MNKFRFYYRLSFLVLGVFLFIVSCTSNSRKAIDTTDEAIREEIEEYTYPLISAFDVTSMLNEIEASYIVGISNAPENQDRYFTEQSKAVNLGIYTADLAYAATYNRRREVQSYFKVLEMMVSDLSLIGAFDKRIGDEIESGMDDQDKMIELVTQISEDVYSYLNRQGRTELSYLILAGTAIEGLYLTTHISENTFQNPKIIEAILYQKEPLVKLESLLRECKDSLFLADIYGGVKEINAVFALTEGVSSMTSSQIGQLTQLLEEIRESSIQ